MARRNHYRIGFTAIELLIVLAIVSMLGALAATAVFRVRSASERTATETTLTKLASALDVHWKAVVDSARKEYDGLPPDIRKNLLALADNLPPPQPNRPLQHPRRDDRARLLHVKFRLKQEFPTSFPMAMNPAIFGTALCLPTSTVPLKMPPNTLSSYSGTGKPAYMKVIADSFTPGGPFPPTAVQSSMLLVMALQQPRSGAAAVGIDQLVGSNFLRSANGFAYLVDAWGNPLQFYGFPGYPSGQGPSTTDLDVTITVPVGQTLHQYLQLNGNPMIDPQDPELLLVDDITSTQQWNRRIDLPRVLHPQFPNPTRGDRTFYLRKMVPVIVSAGPDGNLGGDAAANNNPWMVLPGPGSFDNIYSFRLRQTGARGD